MTKFDYSGRITPELIDALKEDEIFVFGSNTAGRHGAGAAYKALEFGAEMGQGLGLYGQTFAIPTKVWKYGALETCDLEDIEMYVKVFMVYAGMLPGKTFLVTQIGCGLAGLTPEQVAPLFEWAIGWENVHLPQCFWDVLLKDEE